MTLLRDLHYELEEASSALSTLIAEAQRCNHGPEEDRLLAKREGVWAAMTLVKAKIRKTESDETTCHLCGGPALLLLNGREIACMHKGAIIPVEEKS